MYKVIKPFFDLQDFTSTKSGKVYQEYKEGDEYPRKGFKVSEERLAELSRSENKLNTPLIQLVEEEKSAKRRTKKSTKTE